VKTTFFGSAATVRPGKHAARWAGRRGQAGGRGQAGSVGKEQARGGAAAEAARRSVGKIWCRCKREFWKEERAGKAAKLHEGNSEIPAYTTGPLSDL
jgi:hypothetical protein